MPIVGNGSIKYYSHVDDINKFLSDANIESICNSLDEFLSKVSEINKDNVINLSKEAVVFDDDNILMNKINDTLEFYEKNKDYLKNINDYIKKESNNHICDEASEVYEVVDAEYKSRLNDFYSFCDAYNVDVSKQRDYDVKMIAMNNGTDLDIENKIAEYEKYIISKVNPPEPSDNEVHENDFITNDSILSGLSSGEAVASKRAELVEFYNNYVVDAYEFYNKNKDQNESPIEEKPTEKPTEKPVEGQEPDDKKENEVLNFTSYDELEKKVNDEFDIKVARKAYLDEQDGNLPPDDVVEEWYKGEQKDNLVKEEVNENIKILKNQVDKYKDESEKIMNRIDKICKDNGIDGGEFWNYHDSWYKQLNSAEKEKYSELEALKIQFDKRIDFCDFCNSYIDNKLLLPDGPLEDVVSPPRNVSSHRSYEKFMNNYYEDFISKYNDKVNDIIVVGKIGKTNEKGYERVI